MPTSSENPSSPHTISGTSYCTAARIGKVMMPAW